MTHQSALEPAVLVFIERSQFDLVIGVGCALGALLLAGGLLLLARRKKN